MTLFSLNNYSKSITAFEKSLSLRKYWNTYHYLGLSYLMVNENSLAVRVFNEALSLKRIGVLINILDSLCPSLICIANLLMPIAALSPLGNIGALTMILGLS